MKTWTDRLGGTEGTVSGSLRRSDLREGFERTF